MRPIDQHVPASAFSTLPALNPLHRMPSVGALLTSMLLTACGSVPPTPVVPDGSTRVPVNTEPRIQEFKARIASEQQRSTEQRRLEREVDELRAQVSQLRTAAILLAQDAEGKRDSPLPRAESSVTPAHRQALAGLAPPAQLVLAPAARIPLPASSVINERPTLPLNSERPATTHDDALSSRPDPRRIPTQPTPNAAPQPATTAETTRIAMPQASTTRESVANQPVQATRATTSSEVVTDNTTTPMTFRILLAEQRTHFEVPIATAVQLISAARASRQVVIRARTSSDIDDPESRQLATSRAANARAFLVERGVPPERIWVNALGAGGHISENRSAQGRALNSRVDIELFGLDSQRHPTTEPAPTPTDVNTPALAVQPMPGSAARSSP